MFKVYLRNPEAGLLGTPLFHTDELPEPRVVRWLLEHAVPVSFTDELAGEVLGGGTGEEMLAVRDRDAAEFVFVDDGGYWSPA